MSENLHFKHTTVERPYLCNVIHYTGKTIVFIETTPSMGNVSDEINVIRDLYFFFNFSINIAAWLNILFVFMWVFYLINRDPSHWDLKMP